MKERVREILDLEAKAIQNIPLDDRISEAINAIVNCKGKVFTAGIGKAGYVARKTASTLSTTGTPSVFVHPADASHGDVGVVRPDDILLAFSNSGKTREVIELALFCKHLGVETIISVCSTQDSPLGQESTIVLEIGKIDEACPFGLTPTASTSAMIALTDAIALITMQERGFSREDWADRHHGGYLGKKSRGVDE